jgi:predicted outer membrane repeat protein
LETVTPPDSGVASATLTDCTISGNSSTQEGGGVSNYESTLTLMNCTISGNAAAVAGGLWSSGGLPSYQGKSTLINCTISGNAANGRGGAVSVTGSGGGVYNTNPVTLTDCTISGNTATNGGGLYSNNVGRLALTDCTISGNRATDGGGLYCKSGTTTPISACTISGNTATGSGGGIYVYSGQYRSATAALADTIVAGNSGTGGSASDIGGNGAGSGTSGSYNLTGTGGSGGLTAADHNLLDIAAPALSALANNGGPTQTMALLTGSPAIGAGTAIAGVTTDQRGLAIDSPPDIGAYQTPPAHPTSLSFTGLSSPTITYGTVNVTLSGTLASGDQFPPDTESVQVTLAGITQSAALGAGGEFSTTFDTSTLGAAGSPYTIGYSYAGDGTYASASASGALTVSRATPLVRAIDVGGAYDGSAFSATATITGVAGSPASQLEGVSPVLMYFAGSTTSGNPLAGAPIDVGTYTVVANFPGSSDYSSTRSAPVTFVIDKGTTAVAISSSGSRVVFGQSVRLVATVTAGAVTPGGTVTFYDGTTLLGTVALSSGKASLTTSVLAVGSNSITAGYGGGADLQSATSGPLAESVAKAGTHVVLIPRSTFKKKKLVSLKLEAEVLPALPGAGVPAGIVTFEIAANGKKKPKLLGNAVLNGSSATLTVKQSSVLNKRITAVFVGDADFVSSTATPLALTQAALEKAAAPM